MHFANQFPQQKKKPILINIKLLYDVLDAASNSWRVERRAREDILSLQTVARCVKNLAPSGRELKNCVLLLDMMEVKEMEGKVGTGELGFSWSTLHYVLTKFWREKPMILDSRNGMTPSLHRFGVSSRSKVVRLGSWVYMKNLSDSGGSVGDRGLAKAQFRRCVKGFMLDRKSTCGRDAGEIVEQLSNTMEMIRCNVESSINKAKKIEKACKPLKAPRGAQVQEEEEKDPGN